MHSVRLVAVLLLSLLAVAPAAAHKLKVFASAIGDVIEGRVYFVGGGAAIDVPVVLKDSDDTVVGTTRTTAPDGRFSFPMDRRTDFTVAADAQDGHVAEFVVKGARVVGAPPAETGDEVSVAADADTKPAAAPAPSMLPAEAVEEAVARQIAPLTEQIDALRDGIGLRDIVGGVGFILGLFGLWAFLAARRKPS